MLRRLVIALVLVTVLSLSGASAVFACNPGTSLTIDASVPEVSQGDPVELTIAEDNTGDRPLTTPYIELYDGTTTVTYGAASLWDGDTNTDEVLDTDEIWVWKVTVNPVANTTYMATGHGWCDELGVDITYDTGYLLERASVTVRVTNGNGGEGHTPGFWKNWKREAAWTAAGYTYGHSFDGVFGVFNNIEPVTLTLWEAVRMGGGGEKALARHATAALLNAAHPGVDYHFSVAQVIAIVQDAYNGIISFNDAKNELEQYNELGGDLNG